MCGVVEGVTKRTCFAVHPRYGWPNVMVLGKWVPYGGSDAAGGGGVGK